MNGKHYVGLDLTGFEDNGQARPISRVTLMVDDDNAVTAGDDTGVELVAECPHATQAMVNAILKSVKGYAYKMYNAEGTRLNPAAELGDGITAGGVYSVIAAIDDDGTYPDVSAPGEQEMEDEYPTEGPVTRKFNRQIADTRSSITKTAEQIRLEVSKTYATQDALDSAKDEFTTSITQTAESIKSEASAKYATKESVNDFSDAVTKNLGDLQKQIDGQIETYYYNVAPTLANAPASGWKTDLEKQKHEGDLYFDKSTGYAYRFFKDGGAWTWQRIKDTDIEAALDEASKAKDTADKKRRVFISQPTPPYDVGDLWAQGSNGDIMRCAKAKASGSYASGDFIKASKYTDDTIANEAKTIAEQAADHFTWIVQEGGNKTNFTLTSRMAQLAANSISLVGYVTMSDLKGSGTTEINGANLQTGTVSADKISVDDLSALKATIGGWNIGSNGLNYDDGTNRFIIRPKASEKSDLILYAGYKGDNGSYTYPFAVTKDGHLRASDAEITGKVTADSGTIGGFTIDSESIRTGSSTASTAGNVALSAKTFSRTIGGENRDSLRFAIGQNFAVNNNGVVYASNVHIKGDGEFTGKITATSGTIGGWSIGTGLTYNDGTYMGGFRPNNTINVLYIGYKDGEGEQYPFVLRRDGSLTATNATITGKITATSGSFSGTVTATDGKIGGFTIGASAIYNGLSTLGGTANGVYVGTDGIALGGGKFKVTKEGVLTAKSGTVGGFTIDSSAIYDDDHSSLVGDVRLSKTTFSRTVGGTDRASLRFAIGENFAVNNNGVVYASNVHIKGDGEFTGKITATEGKIGTWTIGADKISSNVTGDDGKAYYTAVRNVNSNGPKNYFLESQIDGVDSFYVLRNGSLYAADANITGVIHATSGEFTGKVTATSGTIGKFNIGNSAIYNGLSTLGGTANGVYVGTDGIALGGGKFKVTSVGALTSTSGTIGGWNISANGISYTSEDKLHLVTVRPIQSSTSLPVIYIGRREKETDGWSIPFRVNGDGTCSATDFKISGGSTFSGGLDGATGSISGVTGSYDGSIDSGGTFSGTHSGGSLSGTGGSFGGTVSSGVLSGCNLGGTSLAVTSGGSSNISSYLNGIRMYGPSNAHVMAGSVSLSLSSAGIYDNTNFHASGNISCNGEKSRAIGTEHFGTRLLSAFETPLPTFSDYGTATLDESGVCYICIDPVFAETVNGNCLPTVFLTPYGEGALYVDKVEHDVVTVRGTPGLRFAWETRYAQTNAYVQRLKVMDFDMPDRSGEHDFDSEAAVDLEHTAPDIIVSAQNYLTSYAARAVDYGQAGYEYYTEFERRLTA